MKWDDRISKNFPISFLYKLSVIFGFRINTINEKYVYNDTGRSGYTFINRSSQETETLTKHYGEVGVHTWEEYHIRPDYYSTPREIQIGFSIELNNAK